MLERAIAKGGSVRLSYTLVLHAQTVQDIEIDFTPYDRAMFIVLEAKFCSRKFRGSPPTSALKTGTPVESKKMTNNPQ